MDGKGEHRRRGKDVLRIAQGEFRDHSRKDEPGDDDQPGPSGGGSSRGLLAITDSLLDCVPLHVLATGTNF